MKGEVEEEKDFYYNLKKYQPMCYSGRGVPFFLIHSTYWNSVPCIMFIDIVFALVTILTYLSAKNAKDSDLRYQLVNLYILVMLLMNLTWFLTVFMNPGIVSQRHMDWSQSDQVKYCQKCDRKTVDMQHCRQCQTCVLSLDHHCGFFGKCIAGGQRFAFYGFLFFMFCGFVLLLVGVSINLK